MQFYGLILMQVMIACVEYFKLKLVDEGVL